jgi:hypothetical protein
MEISQGLFWTVLLAASVFAGSAMAYEHGGIPSSDVGLSHHHPRAPRNPWAVSQIPDSTTSTTVDASSESNLRETSDGTPSVSSNSRASAAIDPPAFIYDQLSGGGGPETRTQRWPYGLYPFRGVCRQQLWVGLRPSQGTKPSPDDAVAMGLTVARRISVRIEMETFAVFGLGTRNGKQGRWNSSELHGLG